MAGPWRQRQSRAVQSGADSQARAGSQEGNNVFLKGEMSPDRSLGSGKAEAGVTRVPSVGPGHGPPSARQTPCKYRLFLQIPPPFPSHSETKEKKH